MQAAATQPRVVYVQGPPIDPQPEQQENVIYAGQPLPATVAQIETPPVQQAVAEVTQSEPEQPEQAGQPAQQSQTDQAPLIAPAPPQQIQVIQPQEVETKIVYIERPVEKIVYVERPVVEKEKETLIEKPTPVPPEFDGCCVVL